MFYINSLQAEKIRLFPWSWWDTAPGYVSQNTRDQYYIKNLGQNSSSVFSMVWGHSFVILMVLWSNKDKPEPLCQMMWNISPKKEIFDIIFYCIFWQI